MIYDITLPIAPAMPKIGKGMEILKLLLPQLSKDMQESIAPLLFDSLASHISEAEFMYPDLTWKEICGLITGIVTHSAGGKGQLNVQPHILKGDIHFVCLLFPFAVITSQ